MQKQEFGCERCWPSDAWAAWKARDGLDHKSELIDESHFHVMILGCSACCQQYVSIFTERIDWQGGDDPQYWTLMPITDAEANDLIANRTALDEMSLNAVGRLRQSLRFDHPKGEPPNVFWGSGIFVGLHD